MAEPLIVTRDLTKVYRMESYAVTALQQACRSRSRRASSSR